MTPSIRLFLPQTNYMAGTFIEGEVMVNLEKRRSIDAVYVNLRGEVITRRTKHQGKHTYTRTAREAAANERVIAFSSNSGEVFPEGVQRFPFRLQIPRRCPGTLYYEGGVTGSFGGKTKYEINYWLDAGVEVGKAGDSFFSGPSQAESERIHIRVLEGASLEDFPAQFRNTFAEERKELNLGDSGCCTTRTNILTYKLVIRQLHAYLGDRIPVSLELDNQTKWSADQLSVALYKVSDYAVRSHEKQKEDLITDQSTSINILPGEHKTYDAFISIPTNIDVTTSPLYDRKIRISYWISITLGGELQQRLGSSAIMILHPQLLNLRDMPHHSYNPGVFDDADEYSEG